MTSGYLSHILINKYSFFIRTALTWKSLPGDVISACKTKFFNEHLLDTHMY